MEDNEEDNQEDNQEEYQEEYQEEEPVPSWSWSEDDNSLSWDGGWNYQEAVPRSRG